MCQVHKQYKVKKIGDITQMSAEVYALPGVTKVAHVNDSISVSFNHHRCKEEDILTAIRKSGFEPERK